MPEGDAIWADAQRLRPWLDGQPVLAIECRWPRVVAGLAGSAIRAIHIHGKNLMIPFDVGITLRVHRRMTGYWRRFDDRFPRRDLGIAITTAVGTAACYSVPVVERIDDRALPDHPVLSTLGPDVLSDDFSGGRAVARADPDATIAHSLLDQRVAAGIGNVYRAEALFLTRTDPFRAVGELDDPATVWERASRIMKRNLTRPGMTTRESPGDDHWVYGRARRPCLRCRARVCAEDHGEPPRTLYWCPRCQGT